MKAEMLVSYEINSLKENITLNHLKNTHTKKVLVSWVNLFHFSVSLLSECRFTDVT